MKSSSTDLLILFQLDVFYNTVKIESFCEYEVKAILNFFFKHLKGSCFTELYCVKLK